MSSFRPTELGGDDTRAVGVVPEIRTRNLFCELIASLAQAIKTQIGLGLGQPGPEICELGFCVARRLSARHERPAG